MRHSAVCERTIRIEGLRQGPAPVDTYTGQQSPRTQPQDVHYDPIRFSARTLSPFDHVTL